MTEHSPTDQFHASSFLQGANADYIDQLAARYAADPNSVDAQWADFFRSLNEDDADTRRQAAGPSWARADWPQVPGDDLTAALTGEWLLGQFDQIDAILCSTATRTRQTVEATGLIAPTTFHDEIYEAWPGQLLDVINRHAPAEAATVLVVGHAPGIPQLAATLADLESDPTVMAGLRSYPTSTVSVLSVPADWANLEAGGATLTAVTTRR